MASPNEKLALELLERLDPEQVKHVDESVRLILVAFREVENRAVAEVAELREALKAKLISNLDVLGLRKQVDEAVAREAALCEGVVQLLDPDTLEALAAELGSDFKHSARAHSLRILARKQRQFLAGRQSGGIG